MNKEYEYGSYYRKGEEGLKYYNEHENDPNMTHEELIEETVKIVLAAYQKENARQEKIQRKKDFFYKINVMRFRMQERKAGK